MDLDPDKITNSLQDAAIQADILKKFQQENMPPLPEEQGVAGANPTDPTGAGGGTIGTGQAPIPGEQGFTGVPQQSGQTNTQPNETVGEQQPPMGSVQ